MNMDIMTVMVIVTYSPWELEKRARYSMNGIREKHMERSTS